MDFPIKVYRIAEHSMEPTLSNGDYVLVSSWFSGIGIGDVVVLKYPGRKFYIVKRVRRVRENMLDLRGDNPSKSQDSRHFGMIHRNSVVGKVLLKL